MTAPTRAETDYRLGRHLCVWCSRPLAGWCPDDVFCEPDHQWLWHQAINGHQLPRSPQLDIADLNVAMPPGSVPDNPAAEPWYVPSSPSCDDSGDDERLRVNGLPHDRSCLAGLVGMPPRPGICAGAPQRSGGYSPALPLLGGRVLPGCRALEEISPEPGSEWGCALPGCPLAVEAWYLLAASLAWSGWWWAPHDGMPLRIGFCPEHSHALRHDLLVEVQVALDEVTVGRQHRYGR